jgi:hypothetical protein
MDYSRITAGISVPLLVGRLTEYSRADACASAVASRVRLAWDYVGW